MARTNRKDITLYQEAKSGLRSLFRQTAIVFVGFLAMLLVTGGNPSKLVISLCVVAGIVFVAWSEKRRFSQLLTRETKLTRLHITIHWEEREQEKWEER